MKRRLVRSTESLRDVVNLADYISIDSMVAAFRFLDAVEATFTFLAANHEVGQLCRFDHPETEGLRIWPVDNFRNHLVFYRFTDNDLVVERVLHGACDIEAIFVPPPD